MDKQTEDELYRLAALGKAQGLDKAVRWLMAAMQRPKKQTRRRIKVRVPGRAGDFWIEQDRLREE